MAPQAIFQLSTENMGKYEISFLVDLSSILCIELFESSPLQHLLNLNKPSLRVDRGPGKVSLGLFRVIFNLHKGSRNLKLERFSKQEQFSSQRSDAHQKLKEYFAPPPPINLYIFFMLWWFWVGRKLWAAMMNDDQPNAFNTSLFVLFYN